MNLYIFELYDTMTYDPSTDVRCIMARDESEARTYLVQNFNSADDYTLEATVVSVNVPDSDAYLVYKN
jgi:hypothetical protein